MGRIIRTAVSVFCFLGVALFTSAALAAPLNGHVILAGSSTIQPVAEAFGLAFEKQHTDVRIDVHGGGSSVGITAPQTGLADIGMVSRPLRHNETRQLTFTTFALDGIALIAHASNPVGGLSKQQVIDLYTGTVTNWNKLGGADAQIVVVNKEAGRGTRTLFEQYFGLAEQVVSSALIIGPNGQAILTIAGNPQAIAYVSIGAAEVAIRRGLPIKILALDGVSATQTNVQNGTYGLRRPLNFVTAQPAQGLAKAFLDFVLTPTGQRLVMQHDFVPAYSQIAQH